MTPSTVDFDGATEQKGTTQAIRPLETAPQMKGKNPARSPVEDSLFRSICDNDAEAVFVRDR